MRVYLCGVLILGILTACATNPTQQENLFNSPVKPSTSPTAMPSTKPSVNPVCVGTTELSDSLKSEFNAVADPDLLTKALKGENEGYLCQGKVYQTAQDSDVTVYRAWNSTNPGSQQGEWWSFEEPIGKIADYRKNYQICYQWSPLDTLTQCTLKARAKVVVGNGQSAKCSNYLTYSTSESQQIFIEKSTVSGALENCKTYSGLFSWENLSDDLDEG